MVFFLFQAFMLVSKYLRYSTRTSTEIVRFFIFEIQSYFEVILLFRSFQYLTETDFEQINMLLPALDYRFFDNCTTSSLIGAMPTFRNVADRLNTRGIHLTSAQAHVIAARVSLALFGTRITHSLIVFYWFFLKVYVYSKMAIFENFSTIIFKALKVT